MSLISTIVYVNVHCTCPWSLSFPYQLQNYKMQKVSVFLIVHFKQLLKIVKVWISFRYSKDELPKSSNGRRWGRWRYNVDLFVKLIFLSDLIFLSKLTFLSKLINMSNLIFLSKFIFLSNYHLFYCWHFYQLLLILGGGLIHPKMTKYKSSSN